MGEEKSHIQPVKQGIPVMLVAKPVEEAEINLFDLWQTVARHWLMVASFAALTTIIGLGYIMLVPPVYKVETALRPPTKNDIAAIQRFADAVYDKSNRPTYTTARAFTYFVNKLNSKSARRDYFLNHGVQKKLFPDAKSKQEVRAAFATFDQSLKWNKEESVLSMTGTDPKLDAAMLNDLVVQIGAMARQGMVADLQSVRKTQQILTQSKIDALVATAAQQNQDRIVQLQEALPIAKRLGTSKLHAPTSSIKSGTAANGNASINEANVPLYMRGTKSLLAELDMLKHRKQETAFISGLPELMVHKKQLRKLALNTDGFRLMRVDEAALAPLHPFKPKRRLIILVTLLVGLLLGCFSAFITEAYTRHRLGKMQQIIDSSPDSPN